MSCYPHPDIIFNICYFFIAHRLYHNMRDSFTMENSRHNGDGYETTKKKKVFLKLSRMTFLMLLAIFICSLIAVALLVYNFAVCPADDSVKICTDHSHLNGNSSPVIPSKHDDEFSSPEVVTDVRLPRSIMPISYDMVIVPKLSGENFTFKGDIAIKIYINETCKNISLHSWTLTINRDYTNIKIIDDNGAVTEEEIPIEKQHFIDEKQFLVIGTKKDLEKGKHYLLKIKYVGQISDNLQGFYKSSYTVNGEKRYLASTQFQSTDARRTFPCFDEPEFKAKFKVTLGRPKNMTTLSNMPLERTNSFTDRIYQPPQDYVYDVYQESIKMSTYLVAFVVCDFVNITSGNFSVWARSDAIDSTKYALEIGPKILSFLDDFFGVKYPLPKTDLIAIPDFAFGAMVN